MAAAQAWVIIGINRQADGKAVNMSVGKASQVTLKSGRCGADIKQLVHSLPQCEQVMYTGCSCNPPTRFSPPCLCSCPLPPSLDTNPNPLPLSLDRNPNPLPLSLDTNSNPLPLSLDTNSNPLPLSLDPNPTLSRCRWTRTPTLSRCRWTRTPTLSRCRQTRTPTLSRCRQTRMRTHAGAKTRSAGNNHIYTEI